MESSHRCGKPSDALSFAPRGRQQKKAPGLPLSRLASGLPTGRTRGTCACGPAGSKHGEYTTRNGHNSWYLQQRQGCQTCHHTFFAPRPGGVLPQIHSTFLSTTPTICQWGGEFVTTSSFFLIQARNKRESTRLTHCRLYANATFSLSHRARETVRTEKVQLLR